MANLTSRLVIDLLERVSGPARKVKGALDGITKKIKETNRTPLSVADKLNAQITRNNRALHRARGGLFDAAAGYYALRGAITAPVQAASDFESAMADVKKVADFPTPEAFGKFRKDLIDLSKEIPLSVNGLAEISAAAGEAGFAGDELTKITESAAKLSVAFGTGTRETGKMLATMIKSYGMSYDSAMLLSDAMNHLSNNQASTAPQLMDFFSRVAADSEKMNLPYEKALALGSAMIAGGHEADVAATSFRNMGKALTAGFAATKSQRQGFAQIGLDAEGVAKSMQEDAVGTIINVLEKLNELDPEIRNATERLIFGSEARGLGVLSTNLDALKETLGLVADETNYAGSAFKEFETRNKTFAADMQRFRNIMTYLQITIGSALMPAISRLADAMVPIIEKITAFAEAYPQLTTYIVGAVAGLVAFKGAMAALKFVGLLGKGGFLSLAATGFNLLGKAGFLAAGGTSMTARAMKGLWAAMAGIGKFTWRTVIAPIKWSRFIPKLLWRGFVAPMKWTASLIPMIPWRRLAGGGKRFALAALLKPLKWTTRFIPVIGWAVLAGELLWHGLIKPLGWDKYLPSINWKKVFGSFSWDSWIPAIDWNRIIGSISWPEPPRWLRWLMGDEEVAEVKLNQAALNAMPADKRAATETLAAARNNAGNITDESLQEQAAHAAQLRGEIAGLQAQLDQLNPNAPSFGAQAATLQANMTQLRGELDTVETELVENTQQAENVKQALMVLNETNVTPQINSASIDSALQKTQALERSLARVNGGASPNNTIAPHLRGQRARGGPITRGATYLAGEHGPELITASRSGYVHTAGQTAGMSGGTVNFAPNFTFHNTRAEDANAITSKVRDVLRQEVREMFRGAYADTGMRFS